MTYSDRARHLEGVRALRQQRRARRAWLVAEFGSCGIVVCYRCDVPLLAQGPDAFEVDRIVPGCRGGTYARGNIRPVCPPCNIETGNGVRDGLIL
jgi:hypothetical protein